MDERAEGASCDRIQRLRCASGSSRTISEPVFVRPPEVSRTM
jgi:hypothetical protein